jgi:hypothetical protein
LNANDDLSAYLYLAQRLLSTGGLVDPFNVRRLDSYGGAELFQALVLRVSGNSSGLGTEWFFFALLLVALVVRTVRRRAVLPLLVVVGIGVVCVRPVGVWANVAPTFSGAALTLALLQVLQGSRRGVGDRGRFMVCGLLLAALLSLRLEFFVTAVVTCLLTPLCIVRGRAGLVALRSLATSFGLSFVGWAVALGISSGTFLFPLVSGNWTSSALWDDPSVHSLGQYLHRFVLGAEQDHWDLAILGAVALVGLVVVSARSLVRFALDERRALTVSATVLGIAALGCAVSLLGETVTLTGAAARDIGRYAAPSALACLLFGLEITYDAATSARRADTSGVALARWRPVTFGAGALVLGLWLFAAFLGAPLSFYVEATSPTSPFLGGTPRAEWSSGIRLISGEQVLGDNYVLRRHPYAVLNTVVPRGADVLAAVDDPGLLDFARFTFTTLDIPGAASPAPGFPLHGGANALVGYLRARGINGIVALSPRSEGLYNRSQWEAALHDGIYNFEATARNFLAWDSDLRELNSQFRASVRHVGPFEYIPLH